MTLFFPAQDLHLLEGMKAELHRNAFPPIRIYYPDLATSTYDPLYGEASKEAVQTDTYFDIPAYYKIAPPKKEYARFGVEERRDIMVVFSLRVLDEGYVVLPAPTSGVTVVARPPAPLRLPFPRPGYGCTFEVEGDFYVVTNVMRDDYYGNAVGSPTSWATLGNKARLSSMRGRTLADVSVKVLPLAPSTSTGVVVGTVRPSQEPLV